MHYATDKLYNISTEPAAVTVAEQTNIYISPILDLYLNYQRYMYNILYTTHTHTQTRWFKTYLECMYNWSLPTLQRNSWHKRVLVWHTKGICRSLNFQSYIRGLLKPEVPSSLQFADSAHTWRQQSFPQYFQKIICPCPKRALSIFSFKEPERSYWGVFMPYTIIDRYTKKFTSAHLSYAEYKSDLRNFTLHQVFEIS